MILKRQTGDLTYTQAQLTLLAATALHHKLAPGLLTDEEVRRWWSHRGSGTLILTKERHGPIGLLLYCDHPRHLELFSVAVAPEVRRQGHGRRLFRQMLRSPTVFLYSSFTAPAPDDNQAAHLWLQSLGFAAIRVVPGGPGERDTYLFIYNRPPLCLKEKASCAPSVS